LTCTGRNKPTRIICAIPRASLRRLRALARERRRFGYRRLLIFLRREGFAVNHKRLFRIYREERLMVRKRGGRKRALGMRVPMPVPLAPNDRWSLDFVSDQFVCGRRFRILAVFRSHPLAPSIIAIKTRLFRLRLFDF
jgi:hypothetical protein